MIHKSVYVTREQRTCLRRIAKKEKTSMSEMIRRGIDAILKKHGAK
jgi:hypothetical protein